MNIQAINGVNSISKRASVSFGQRKHQSNVNTQATDENASSAASKALRAAGLALIAAASTAPLTSCDNVHIHQGSPKATAWAISNYWANFYYTFINCDGKPDTVYIREKDPRNINIAASDSLYAEGRNIGIPHTEGPVPGEYPDVIFVYSHAHNLYDNKEYDTYFDGKWSSQAAFATITKISDRYVDPDHPDVKYMRSEVSVIDGKGIRIDRFVSKSPTERGNYAGYEVRTNGSNGKTNAVQVYDKNDQLVWVGQYEKGQLNGTFMYASLTYDDKGNVNYNPETGEPEIAHYNFKDAYMKTARLSAFLDKETEFEYSATNKPLYDAIGVLDYFDAKEAYLRSKEEESLV